MPPCTTKRTTTSIQAKNNQNCDKIELYGSLTTKELKKKHSFRLIGGVVMGSWHKEDMGQGSSWRTWRASWWLAGRALPHSCADKLGGKTVE